MGSGWQGAATDAAGAGAVRTAALLGAMQFVNYLVIAVNMRAVAHMQYGWIAASDAAICLLNFTIIKRVAAAESRRERVLYIVGGTLGALAGVWLSRAWG